MKHNLYASIAGTCAATAGLLGKLSGSSEIAINIYISALFLMAMIVCNALMWTFYSKALNLSTNSIGPTLVSTAVNYIFSAMFGVTFFQEKTSLMWWSGISFVLIGLVLITKGNNTNIEEKQK